MSTLKVDTIQDAAGVFEHARVVQVVNVTDSAVTTGTTVMPFDDTIPQNTEGDEYMTLAITPTHASNKLVIEVVVFASSSIAAEITTALFQDSTAGALAAVSDDTYTGTAVATSPLTYYMTTGTTSATTFKVRVGAHSAGTTTFNGNGSARRFGGVAMSSITITEIRV